MMNKEISRLLQGVQSAITALSRYNDVENEASARKAMYDLGNYLDEFFSKNVVIPKGEDRHPDADVIHLAAEGYTVQWTDKHNGLDWSSKRVLEFPTNVSYRIKPQEPVYEWQWVVQEKEGGEHFVPQGWHTFEELQPQVWSLVRLEETKRERK